MKTILVINDDSSEAKHAIEFAVILAKKAEAIVLLANTCIINYQVSGKVITGDIVDDNDEALSVELSIPEIEEFDISKMNTNQLAAMINKNQIWMVVKGMPDLVLIPPSASDLNIHAVLNKVLCPILFIPESWQLKHIERLVYIADLRYCRIAIVRYLAKMAEPWQADLLVAHLSAKGLPDIEEKYALSVFSNEVSSKIDYDRLFFNNIKEKDLTTAVDVIINGMHNDLLVLVNHRFHFEEIIGRYITASLPSLITVPLLIFPY